MITEMTNPAAPTTIRTTPTVDTLIPLTDVVTANFKIAINAKLDPIQPASFIRFTDTLRDTRCHAQRYPQSSDLGVA
jgi:hypothetical protein